VDRRGFLLGRRHRASPSRCRPNRQVVVVTVVSQV
jgi:hypothetical protein